MLQFNSNVTAHGMCSLVFLFFCRCYMCIIQRYCYVTSFKKHLAQCINVVCIVNSRLRFEKGILDVMKYVVAVSGGVDSVVLLHKLVQQGGYELIVAHFDHGIRLDSAADARFVQALAASYSLPFVMRREELGQKASEDTARERRYLFLRSVAKEYQAMIATAHHADDVVESIAINIYRGTGWRGLAVLDASDMVRPLTDMRKADIRKYACEHRLEWVEDSTNAETMYLRNRMRRTISMSLSIDQKDKIRDLWGQQLMVKKEISNEMARLLPFSPKYDRYFFTVIDQTAACELLRMVMVRANVQGLTRPQLERALLAVKTALPGTKYQAGSSIVMRFSRRTFVVETP